MGTDRDRARSLGYAGSLPRPATPDTATWDVRENAEVELLGEFGFLDEVDLVDESWAPGQRAPGMPADEVLHIHTFPGFEPSADDLDLDDRAYDSVSPVPDELFEGETDE